jgi:hypothetical protein
MPKNNNLGAFDETNAFNLVEDMEGGSSEQLNQGTYMAIGISD